MAVGDYYHVPEPDVMAVRDRYRLRDEELPVVYFLAARARVAPSVIMTLRLGGRSWLDIGLHYGLDPHVFFVPLRVVPTGPPYGRAYGYYKKFRARSDWHNVALTDREIGDLVNLRFMSDYHGISPDSVMERRGRGEVFVSINDDYGRAKGKKGGPWDSGAGKGPKNKGKNKNK